MTELVLSEWYSRSAGRSLVLKISSQPKDHISSVISLLKLNPLSVSGGSLSIQAGHILESHGVSGPSRYTDDMRDSVSTTYDRSSRVKTLAAPVIFLPFV